MGKDSQSSRYWHRNLQRDISGPGEETDKDSDDNQTRSCMGRSLDENWKSCSESRKQEWAKDTPKLDNSRKLRGIYLFPQTRGDNWKDPQLRPCREKHNRASWKWLRSWNLDPRRVPKTIYGSIGESHKATSEKISIYETWRPHCRQRFHFDDALQSGSQINPYASSNEDSGCNKLQWTRDGKSSRQFQHGIWLTRAKKGHSRSTKRQKKVHFATLMDRCHLKKCRVGTQITEVQRQSRALESHCKRRLWSPCSFYWTGLVCVPHDSCKTIDVIARLPGCDGRAADAISAYTQVKLEDASRLLKIPKSECPDVWIRLLAKILVEHWRSCGTSRTKFIWTPTSKIVMEKTIRWGAIGTWMEKKY